MSWNLFSTPLPFGAGAVLCPPDPPPCICGERVNPACPQCGDPDFSAAGGAENDPAAEAVHTPVAASAVGAHQT